MKVSNTSERLRQIMEERGLRQTDLLSLTKPFCEEHNVKMNKSDISQYVNGKVQPQQEKLFVLSAALNVSEGWLIGYDVPMERPSDVERFQAWADDYNSRHFKDHIRPSSMEKYPLLGEVACGEPIIANEQHEVFSTGNRIEADAVVLAKGDSMTGARINDGDVVFIRYQPTVENGEIAAVIVESADTEDAEVTLKRFYRYGNDLVVLRPENPKYPDIEIPAGDGRRIKIVGKAVAFQSDLV